MTIKAIIFDMDGVLIDARDWHYESLNKALSLFGFDINMSDHLNYFDGLPTRKKLIKLTNEYGFPEKLHEFINELKQKYTQEIAFVNCKPVFAHEYMLASLADMNFKLACCSNSVRESVDMMLSKAQLYDYFNYTLSNEDVEKPKPSPDMYQKAVKYLKMEPSECLIVEDNENGIKAAIASGCHVLRVKDPDDVHLDRVLTKVKEINNE